MKPSLSVADQVRLLAERGLILEDEFSANDFLTRHNYYRFSGYARYFQEAPHLADDRFRSDVTFEEIRAVYERDESLRGLLSQRLGIVELLLRTHVARAVADTHGPYGSYLDESFYRDSSSQQRTAEVCRRDIMRSRERHILKHVGDDALNPDMAVLPVWSAVEAFSFGTLSKVIERGADGSLAEVVASGMGAPRAGFAYRVKAMVYLRNRCAHHSRLWHHSIIDAGPTPNNVRAKAKRAAGQFAARSVLDVVASLDDILVRAGSTPPILPELIERFASAPGFWEGLSVPRSPRDHPVA